MYSLIAVLLVLIIWTIWGNTALMVSTVTVSSNRIPAAFNGFLIAQVSDLHVVNLDKMTYAADERNLSLF